MKTTIGQRLALLIESENLNNLSFAKRVGVSPTSIGYITGERQSKPGFELIEKIATAFPQLDIDWLVRGYGEMRKGTDASASVYMTLLQNERKRYHLLTSAHVSLSSDFDVALNQAGSASA